jgi:hypothetical protein
MPQANRSQPAAAALVLHREFSAGARRPGRETAPAPHNTIDEILTESIQREESGVELYPELLALVKDKSVVLEEYATRLVSAEAVTSEKWSLC